VKTIKRQHEEQQMILSVSLDKKQRRLYHLYAEAEQPILSVHEDILIKYRLMKGMELSERQLSEIRMEDERYRAYILAIGYLGLQPRTKQQIQRYLLQKEFEEANIQYALERLETEHIVDDEQYARQFASGRMKNSLKGRLWIKQELRQRGVSSQAAAEAVDDLDHEVELTVAITAAGKKWRTLKGEPRDKRHKLFAFLLRRGFPGQIAKEAIQAVVAGEGEAAFEAEDGLLLDN
jgi:regulatory protein